MINKTIFYYTVLPISYPYGFYSYKTNKNLKSGDIVIVPFGRKNVIGIVFGNSNYKGEMKEILYFTGYTLCKLNILFLKSIAIETISSIESIVKLILPNIITKKLLEFKIYKVINTDCKEIQKLKNYNKEKYFYSFDLTTAKQNKLLALKSIEVIETNIINITKKTYDKSNNNSQVINNLNNIILSEDQKKAVNNIVYGKQKVLLQGITGSGKTEVYFSVINKIINDNDQCLILLPEIQLAQDIYNRLLKYIDINLVALIHSKTSKNKIWHNIITGKVKYIVGTRSSMFMPFKNLKLIIMDEEHDKYSFNQEKSITYNAFNIVNILSNIYKSKLIFVSATPSIECIWNAKYLKNFDFIKLKNRYHNVVLPKIKIIDKKSNQWIENDTRLKIINHIEKGNQVFLFLNKKGYSPIYLCKKCNIKITCQNCSSNMTFYKFEKILKCCYCFAKSGLECNSCGNKSLIPCGPGTERIIEELNTFIKTDKYKIIEFTNNTENKNEVINEIYNNKYQIIVGTQILAKGYTFNKLQLVCIIDADSSMYSSDVYSFEKTYQLLTQVIGRAGRVLSGGEVLVQTRYKDSSFIKSILNQDMEKFIDNEINIRKELSLPPFNKIIIIKIEHKNNDILKQYCYDIYLSKKNYFLYDIQIIGPTKDYIYKKNNIYCMKFLIKYNPNKINFDNLSIIKWIKSSDLYKKVAIKILINPVEI